MNRIRKILGVVLAVLFLTPILTTFTAFAENSVVSYDTASDGDLLYTVNFNGDDVWTPAQISGWGSMTASVIDNGYGAMFSPTSAYKNAWGGELNGFSVAGKAYTVVFTATSLYNDGQHIGISLNGGGYTFVTPGRDRYALGWWNSYQSKKAFGSYTHSETCDKNISRTYAIEIAADSNGNATKYNLYVQDGTVWTLLYTMSDFSNFNWGASGNITLWFVKYLAGINGTYAVDDYNQKRTDSASVSNVKIYKGNYYIYPQNGVKLMDLNFNTTEDYTPGFQNGKNEGAFEVSTDGKSVTLKPNAGKGLIWGDEIEPKIPVGAGKVYTIFYHVDFEVTGNSIQFGIYPDAYSGLVMRNGGNAIPQHSTTKEKDGSGNDIGGNNWRNKSDLGANVRDFAVVVDTGTNAQTLYAKNQNGTYIAVISYSSFQNFNTDYLNCSVMTYCGTANKYVTYSDVSIYKGDAVDVWDPENSGYNAYNSKSNSSLLSSVDFNAENWNPSFADDNNKGANIQVSENGTSVLLTVQNANNKRAMWGATLLDTLPLYNDVQYTFVYDITFGNDNVGFSIYPDGSNGLLIGGNGDIYWYDWNSYKLKSNVKWTNITNLEGKSQTFAVTMDYQTKTYALFVKMANGLFEYVTSLTKSAGGWSERDTINCRLYVRSMGGTPDETYTAQVSNLRVYKGTTYAAYPVETKTGAAVRLDNPTGIRFTGSIEKARLDELKEIHGENVKVGMLITPTVYLTEHKLDFTKAALDGCTEINGQKYEEIDALALLPSEDGSSYIFNCALTEITEDHDGLEFSAIAYLKIIEEIDNEMVVNYYYAQYDEAKHSRSISFVATMALEDKNSTYTEQQRGILSDICKNTYTVMTYNIEMYDSNKKWEDDRDPAKAMSTIVNESPDFVGLNEVNFQWNTYETTLTNNGYTQVSGDTTGGSHRVDIFYKTAKFNNVRSGSLYYKAVATSLSVENTENADETLDNSGTKGRMFTYVLLEDKVSGEKILFIATHLHYGGTGSGHEEDDKLRRYEIKTLLAWINAQTFTYDSVIITGDMNSHYKSGEGKTNMNIFKDAGYGLTVEDALAKGDNGGTLDGTGHTTRKDYIFDYVIVKGNAKSYYYSVIDNKDSNGIYPSDHLPVISKVYCY